jgi:hypothetical protein
MSRDPGVAAGCSAPAARRALGGRDIETESFFERLDRRIEERPRYGSPDVVDHHVQAAEHLARGAAQAGLLSGVAEISYHDVRGSASRLDRGCGSSKLIRGTSGDDYIGPRLSQRDGRGRTDASSGTGDHRDPAVQAEPIEHTHTAKITTRQPGRGQPTGRSSCSPLGSVALALP